MKKFFAAMLASLCLVLASCVPAHAVEAKAAPQMQTAVSVSKISASPGGVVHAAPQTLGNVGVKPLSYWLPATYCYWAMNGGYYCYRYGCTNFEIWLQGCYNGYVRMNPYTWV